MAEKESNSLRLGTIILSAVFTLLYFIPFGVLRVNGPTIADEKTDVTMSLFRLIAEPGNWTPINDLGFFTGLNFSGVMWVLYVPLAFAIVLLAVSIFRGNAVRKWMYNLLVVLAIAVPVYAYRTLGESIKVAAEVSKFSFGIGLVLFIAVGLIMLFIGMNLEGVESQTDYTINENQMSLIFIISSIAMMISMLLPFIGVDIKTGLSSYKTYTLSLVNLINISGDMDVKVFLGLYGEAINLGFFILVYGLPLVSLATIAASLMKQINLAKILAVVQGIYAGASVILLSGAIKDNQAMYQGVRRVFTQPGYVIMLATSALLIIVAVRELYNEEIINRVTSSKREHRISYILLAIVGLVLWLMPQIGVKTSTLNELGMLSVEEVPGLKILFNQAMIPSITGGGISLIGYVVPIALVLLIVFAVLKQELLMKLAAFLSGIFMIVSPLLVRGQVNRMIEGYEVGQFRAAYVLMMLAGAALLIQVYTNRTTRDQVTRTETLVNEVIQGGALLVFAVIQLYPLVWLVLASFMTEKEMFSGKVLALPEVWHVEHYSKALFGTRADETIMEAITRVTGESDFSAVVKFITGNTADGNIMRYFANSLFVTGISIIIVIVCASLVSYALTRIKWKGRSLVFMFFTLGMMIPVHVALAPLYVTFADIGILGTLWSLIIPYAGFGLSFAIIVISGFMQSIPVTIEEAATIDGATRFQTFRKIILPMLSSSLSTVAIFTFMGNWNELMFASVFINKGTNRTITVGINHLASAQYNTEYGLIFSGLVIASLPTLIFYLIASEQVQKSLVVGAVKE